MLIPKIIYFHKGKRIECENALFDPPKHSPFSFYKTSPSIQILPAKEAKKRKVRNAMEPRPPPSGITLTCQNQEGKKVSCASTAYSMLSI